MNLGHRTLEVRAEKIKDIIGIIMTFVIITRKTVKLKMNYNHKVYVVSSSVKCSDIYNQYNQAYNSSLRKLKIKYNKVLIYMAVQLAIYHMVKRFHLRFHLMMK